MGNCTCISRNFSKSEIEHFILQHEHLILAILKFTDFKNYFLKFIITKQDIIYCEQYMIL